MAQLLVARPLISNTDSYGTRIRHHRHQVVLDYDTAFRLIFPWSCRPLLIDNKDRSVAKRSRLLLPHAWTLCCSDISRHPPEKRIELPIDTFLAWLHGRLFYWQLPLRDNLQDVGLGVI